MTPDGRRPGYVHGYSEREGARLADQAATLAELLHRDTLYPAGNRVLEVGCGVGAQTAILAGQSPEARFTCLDLSGDSLREARSRAGAAGLGNACFSQADVFALPFRPGTFDHAFVCFVLEHLGEPVTALGRLRKVIRPGGTITVVEGDHGSATFHPESAAASRAIRCLVELQARDGGNALIGRRLYPLLQAAGFRDVRVSPRVVYADTSRTAWVEGFTRNTVTSMVEGVGDRAVAEGLMGAVEWRRGIEDLRRTAGPDGTFSYTFFKAVALA